MNSSLATEGIEEIKKLVEEELVDITEKVCSLDDTVQALTKEQEKKKEHEKGEKGWKKTIEIATKEYEKIMTTAADQKTKADLALDEIKQRSSLFTGVIALLIAFTALTKEKYWGLWALIYLMLFGIKCIEFTSGNNLWKVLRENEDLVEEQTLLFDANKLVVADLRLAQAEIQFDPELIAEIKGFEKLTYCKKRVAKLSSFIYWANFIIFCAFSIAVPVVLHLFLDSAAKTASKSNSSCNCNCKCFSAAPT